MRPGAMLESLLENVPISFHIFMLFATVTVLGAAGVAFFKNIVYSAFSLLLAFAGVVGLFAFLSADFLAAVQLMVYVGGILVLILFAVMLTNRIDQVRSSNPISNIPMGVGLLAVALMTLLGAAFGFDWQVKAAGPYQETAATIGRAFLGEYLLNFEIAGILLLAALVAAVVVARKEIRDLEDEEGRS
jgi:NADH-quinone oxidoreductase subunit J